MISIGLDLSLTHTGYVVINDKGKVLRRGVIKSKPCGDRPMDEIKRILKIRKDIFDIIEDFLSNEKEKTIICIEGLAFMAQGTSLTQLAGLSYMTRANLDMYSRPFIIVAPTTLKKFITGSGKGDKDQIMMAVYKNYGFEASDNNEADAFSLSVCGMAVMGKPINKLIKPQEEVVNLLKKQL